MPDDPQILALQSDPSIPSMPGTESATDMLLAPRRAADRMRHFPEEVYRLAPESNLVRLVKTLIGDAGAGQLRKKYILRRLQQTLQGTHFFDLDRFYGALFGVQRRTNEILAVDPYIGTATSAEWDTAQAQDSSYRSRIAQFAQAISYGPSPIGMELISEALLSVDCDVFESYRDVDAGVVGVTNRRMFTVQPKREITAEEHYDLVRVLNRIKPADALVIVDASGVSSHAPIDLRGVHADSEYWEVISKVQPRSVTTALPYPIIDVEAAEQPRVPFGGYQGEAWSYNGDIAGVSPYVIYGSESVAMPTEIKVVGENTIASFPPESALASQRNILAGRYISDAVYQAHPYGDRRLGKTDVYVTDDGQVFALLDTGQTVRLGVNYIDRIPIPGLLEALRTTSDASFDSSAPSPDRFWVTPERPIESDFQEVLEVRLVSPRAINYIGLKTAHYPHILTIQVYDETAGAWVAVNSSTITDSIPRVPGEPQPGAPTIPLHPSSDAHWMDRGGKFDRMTSSRVRIILQRTGGQGAPPQKVFVSSGYAGGGFAASPTTTVTFNTTAELNAFVHHVENDLWPQGIATQYNAVSGDTVGNYITYNVPSQVALPGYYYDFTTEKPIPYSLAIRDLEIGYRISDFYDVPAEPATTTDLLGSLVQFELRENPAELAITDDGAWRSNPQPVSNAVVNFYADTRDVNGAGQLIDRFYLNPLTPGPHVSIYWSNSDIPEDAVRADNDDLNYPLMNPTGTFIETSTALEFDTVANAHIDIDNLPIQFDPRKPFSVLVAIRTGFAYNVGHHVIADLGGYKLRQHGSLLKFSHPDGTTASVSIEYPANAELRFLLEADAETVTIGVQYGVTYDEDTATAGTPTTTQPPTVRIGAPLTGSADPASFKLMAFLLRRGSSPYNVSFLTAPDVIGYVRRSDRPSASDTTLNAILRFSPGFFSDLNERGFKGGPGEFYDFLSWTPIARDYILQKGFVHVPPTLAKFWKFEFTNLVAEPYESFVPINRVTKLFPAGTAKETIWQEVNADPGSGPPGTRAAIDLGDRLFIDSYSDAASLPSPASPTEALFAPDPNMKQRFQDQSWSYGFQPWHMGLNAPSFNEEGVHEYEQIEILHSNKVAYFVGLQEIASYRVDYAAGEDTTQYVERFADDANILAGYDWTFGENYITSGSDPTCTIRSIVFNSLSDVIGVQFATQQSQPVQIIFDDDLRDPAMILSDFTDTDTWHKLGDAAVSYLSGAHSVLIERSGLSAAPGEAATVFSLVTPVVHPTFSRDYITAAEVAAAAAAFGGIISPAAVTSTLGTISAAVRFTSITDTTSFPYYLQIRRADTNVVLVEKPVPARANQLIEDYISYEIGTIAPAGTPIAVSLLQKTKTASRIELDTLSAFDAGIIWDFSNDGGSSFVRDLGTVKNNPHGAVSFSSPGNELIWRCRSSREDMFVSSLQIRPIYADRRTARPAGVLHGPNLSTYDAEPPVTEDPEFLP